MSDYNGWKNRATWLINIWFNPESKADVIMARETFEESVSELYEKHGFLADFIDTDINWDQLINNFEEE